MTENQINDLRCNIGGYISDERNSKKNSQEKLSNMSGVSRQMISKIENGNENYEINALLKLILALDLRPLFIDFDENNEVENEIKKRFLLQKSEIDNFFVVTDVENQMVCTFENRKFNDTQSLRYLNDVSHTVVEIAKQMRELAEWLHEHHKDII
jgi:transcriptional regulator with XRE-family HTH domain